MDCLQNRWKYTFFFLLGMLASEQPPKHKTSRRMKQIQLLQIFFCSHVIDTAVEDEQSSSFFSDEPWLCFPSVLRTHGQSGSVCVQRREDGDRDGSGSRTTCCCCQSSWSQCVQQVDTLQGQRGALKKHAAVFRFLMAMLHYVEIRWYMRDRLHTVYASILSDNIVKQAV